MTYRDDVVAQMAAAAASPEPVVKAKATKKRPVNHRIVYALECPEGTWQVVRIVLDGQGYLVGETSRPTLSLAVAADLMQHDATRTAADVYRHMASAEADARRLAQGITKAQLEAKDTLAEADRMDARAAELRAREREAREKAMSLPLAKDTPQLPENAPAHVRLRWQPAPNREDALRAAVALASQAETAEHEAQMARSDAQHSAEVAARVSEVQKKWADIADLWVQLSQHFVEVPL